MKAIFLACAFAAIAPAALAQSYGAPISLDQAQKIVAAAQVEARKLNFRMAFAVVEPSGVLVAFGKMDDVQYGSARISQEKAVTAAQFRRPTKALADSIATNAGVATMGAVAVEGGVPIYSNGKIIGALGISGASSAQDGQVAAAALAATGFSAP
jgi:glc operon protein GlcG